MEQYTKLFNACKNGDLKTVKDLHKKGVDIHAEKDRAFQLANEYGQTEVIEFLNSKVK